jgi:hypothetical protein
VTPFPRPAPGPHEIGIPPSPRYPTPQYPAQAAKRPFWLLPVAGLWSAGLIVAAYLGDRSLVQVNGPKILIPIGAPLAVVVLVALLLAVARRTPTPVPRIVAWILSGLLDGLALVGLLTIGIFIMPVALAVTAACIMR